jgi:formylglycine-generating enzyme required for sulfatase activity
MDTRRKDMVVGVSGFSIIDDQPTEHDALDFKPYRDALVGIVRDPHTQTPLVMAVYGAWGSGKTSLMKMVRAELDKSAPEGERSIHTMWFDAWKYHREEVLWRALLLQVLNCLESLKGVQTSEEAAGKIADWKQRLYEDVEREELGEFTFELTKAGKGVLKLGLGLLPAVPLLKDLITAWEAEPSTIVDDLMGAFGRQTIHIHERKVQFLEEFQRGLTELVREHVRSKGGVLVAFVDDLDRCLPERALEVLEAIKLFLDVPGCLFILGLDREAVIEAVQERYRDEVKAQQYLEKIIQLPFLLPPIEADDMAEFVESLVPALPGRCRQVFTLALEPNPRLVKRSINAFLFLWKLSRERLAKQIKPVRLAKVVVVQHRYPALYELLVETPRYLKDLETHFRAEEARPAKEVPDVEQAPAVATLPAPLQPFAGMGMLRRLLTMHPEKGLGSEDANFVDLTPQELRAYVYLTRRTAPEPAAQAALRLVEPELVYVPEGEFLMGSSPEEVATCAQEDPERESLFKREVPQQRILLPEYQIGRYPVTNVEYRAFVRDTGYAPPPHWEGDAYLVGRGDHPVENVNWNDARAFCGWLMEKTGRAYRLPTEAEWEKAARGSEGRIYPWGDEFDAANCNSLEADIGDTTPVGQYSPQGDSPYGAADMAGNVSEWTSTLFESYPYDDHDGREETGSRAARVVRGGSFGNGHVLVRCAYRGRTDADARVSGFRVAVSPGAPS